MQTLSFIVGVIGNVLTLLVFASPIKTFLRVVKSKSTEDFEGLPYICTFLSSALWTYYGLTKPGALLVATVNMAGMLLEFVYITLFLIYSPPLVKAKAGIQVAILDVGFLGGAILVTRLAVSGDLRVEVIGLLCVGLSLIMYASPLSAMKTVVRTKSVEYMPFLLSFFLFFNGGVWALYAVLVRDLFVGVPNGLGCLLGTVQLIIYAIYRDDKRSKIGFNLEQGTLEDARESLVQSYHN